MNVVEAGCEPGIVPDGVLPVASLPDPPLALARPAPEIRSSRGGALKNTDLI
jgi:hypothetical protein